MPHNYEIESRLPDGWTIYSPYPGMDIYHKNFLNKEQKEKLVLVEGTHDSSAYMSSHSISVLLESEDDDEIKRVWKEATLVMKMEKEHKNMETNHMSNQFEISTEKEVNKIVRLVHQYS